MIRINAGLYKGRVLKSTPGRVVRPTMSRLKLSFFDIVQGEIRETIFLDGFAGTGNMGIEAISRGAEYVIFVDELAEAARTIRHNLEKIGVASDHYRIVHGDFNRTVIALAKQGMSFDWIYLDPPYALLEYANPLKVVFKRGILKPGGTIVLERPTASKFESPYFKLARTQRLGKESLDFYRHE
jgi:16S rRNA (guanine966-N2)-methyltransferase